MTNDILQKKASILLIEERGRKDIIVGAPHHTPGGVKKMPCPEHPDGDENAGVIARQIAEELKLSSIIACYYPIDPNKSLRTDYSIQIVNWNPKYLIEIHGHGAKKIKDNAIEISSGSEERNKISISFSKCLQEKIQNNKNLQGYSINGDFAKIHFKASNTATITHQVWTSIHIELPPSLRLDSENNLPLKTKEFIQLLEETITEVCV